MQSLLQSLLQSLQDGLLYLKPFFLRRQPLPPVFRERI